MATHSSILAWRNPWTEEPGGLQSIGSQRVEHDRSNLEHTYARIKHLLTWALGFPGSSDGKASAYNAGDLGSIPGWEDPLEKELATHSSILAWKIPWTEEPGRLQFTGLQRVGHDWVPSPHLNLGPSGEWYSIIWLIYLITDHAPRNLTHLPIQ